MIQIVMPSGSPNTMKKLEEVNIEVIEVDLKEIMKGWGAIHCMSVFLNRDPIL